MATDFYSLLSFVDGVTRGCIASATKYYRPYVTSATMNDDSQFSFTATIKIVAGSSQVFERQVYYYDRQWHTLSEHSKSSDFLTRANQSSITLEGLLKLYIYPTLEETLVPIDAVV